MAEEDDFINRVLQDVARQEAGQAPGKPLKNLASLSDDDMEEFIRSTARVAKKKYDNNDKSSEVSDCPVTGMLGPFFLPLEKRLHDMVKAMPGVSKSFVDRLHVASDCEVFMLTIAVESREDMSNNIVPGLNAPMVVVDHMTDVIRDAIEHIASILTAAAGATEHKDFFIYEQFMLKATAAKRRLKKKLTPGELRELGLQGRERDDE